MSDTAALNAAVRSGGPAEIVPHVKLFDGAYRLQKKGGGKARVSHRTFEKAVAEAGRLLGKHPDATFILLQEVACVKLAPVDGTPSSGAVEWAERYARVVTAPDRIDGSKVTIDVAYEPKTKRSGYAVYRSLADGEPDEGFDPIFCPTRGDASEIAIDLASKWGVEIVMEGPQ